MAKFRAKGAILAYLSGSSYIPVAQIVSFEANLGETREIDVTTLDQANNYLEFLQSWIETQPLSVNLKYDPGITSHAFLRTNHGGSTQTWKITWPDTGTATEAFSAWVKGFSVSVDKDTDELLATVVLRPTGAFTHTA